MVKIIDTVFEAIDDKLDHLIKEHPIKRNNQLEQLSKLYWDSWEHLKEKMGTSAGWPWFGEYMIFYTLMHHIQKETGMKFRTALMDPHGSVKVFLGTHEDKHLLLAHNAKLMLEDSKPVRPDIFLLYSDHLVFTIDVKVCITSTWAMAREEDGALSKLARTIEDSKWKKISLGYLISLHKDMPTSANKCIPFQKKGVGIVGPRGGSIEKKLEKSTFPMIAFESCINEILGRLS